MQLRAIAFVFFLFPPLVVAKKQQSVEQAVVSWYEGPVRDCYWGSCPNHPDARHHSLIGIHCCWRNVVVLKASDKYLTLEDHCAVPWKFQEGETVEFQRDIEYPRKLYINRHVFTLTRESDTPDEVERSAPVIRDNPPASLSESKAASGGTLGIVAEGWEQGEFRGIEIKDISENGSAALAGLHKGDVITELNGNRLRSPKDLDTVVGQIEPGSKVSIVYMVRTNLGWMPKETVAILAKAN
jgi:hypothetical protein